MIDPEWLEHAAMLAETPLDKGAAALACELGEDAEILPWLLVIRGGFSRWPAARAALNEVNRAVIRLRFADPHFTGVNSQEERRAASEQAILRSLSVSSRDDFWAIEEMIKQRLVLSSDPKPNDFIV